MSRFVEIPWVLPFAIAVTLVLRVPAFLVEADGGTHLDQV
jgi:hypothetical protein